MCKATKKINPMKAENREKKIFLLQNIDIVFLLLIVLVAFTIRYASLTGAGVTMDEPIYTFVGIAYVDYLMNFDFSAQSWSLNMEHPPAGKIIYGVAA